MIKNIIFDFGDIFINLDKEVFTDNLKKLGVLEKNEQVKFVFDQYEMGLIETEKFVDYIKENFNVSKQEFISAWNSILLDFPRKRLDFLQKIVASNKYRLFLLSNTNHLHINWIKDNWGANLYNEFKNCFEKFYLSQEIHFRKPNSNIYEFVMRDSKLVASETLFIDDTKINTDKANELGIHVWNLIPGEDDITELFDKKSMLF